MNGVSSLWIMIRKLSNFCIKFIKILNQYYYWPTLTQLDRKLLLFVIELHFGGYESQQQRIGDRCALMKTGKSPTNLMYKDTDFKLFTNLRMKKWERKQTRRGCIKFSMNGSMIHDLARKWMNWTIVNFSEWLFNVLSFHLPQCVKSVAIASGEIVFLVFGSIN